jgi:hypothetical protein
MWALFLKKNQIPEAKLKNVENKTMLRRWSQMDVVKTNRPGRPPPVCIYYKSVSSVKLQTDQVEHRFK